MSDADPKPHLSPTQIGMFCRCAEAYRRSYIEGEKLPPSFAMARGRGVHSAAEANFRQKIDSREDLPSDVMADIAAAAFDEATKNGVLLTPEEQRRADRAHDETLDATVRMAKFHAERQAPDYQPVLVEARFRIELPQATHDLVGVLDMAAEGGVIADLKTSGKRVGQTEADQSLALTTYAGGHRQLTGELPKALFLDRIVYRSGRMERELLPTVRGREHFEALAARVNVVLSSIAAGNFPPAVPGIYPCTPTACGYWRTCPYVNRTGPPKVVDIDLTPTLKRAIADTENSNGGANSANNDARPLPNRANRTLKPRKLAAKALRALLREQPRCPRCQALLTAKTAVEDPGQPGRLACDKCVATQDDRPTLTLVTGE